MSARWEKLELWMFDYEPDRFTSVELASMMGVSNSRASQLIQAYLVAQRAPGSTTLFVLKREGRTKQAVWSVGHRIADARVIGRTLYQDVAVKIRRAYAPDIAKLAKRNPRAARFAEAKLEAVIEGALHVLAAAVDIFEDE